VAGGFVTEEDRHGARELPIDDAEIRVADAAVRDLDPDLPRSGIGDFDVIPEHQRLAGGFNERCLHDDSFCLNELGAAGSRTRAGLRSDGWWICQTFVRPRA